MVDFDLFRTQLTEAGFDLHKVEEIYERIREAIETAPQEERAHADHSVGHLQRIPRNAASSSTGRRHQLSESKTRQ